jgi:hypothetical protein
MCVNNRGKSGGRWVVNLRCIKKKFADSKNVVIFSADKFFEIKIKLGYPNFSSVT